MWKSAGFHGGGSGGMTGGAGLVGDDVLEGGRDQRVDADVIGMAGQSVGRVRHDDVGVMHSDDADEAFEHRPQR